MIQNLSLADKLKLFVACHVNCKPCAYSDVVKACKVLLDNPEVIDTIEKSYRIV